MGDFFKKNLISLVTLAMVILVYVVFPRSFEGQELGVYMFNATRLILLFFMFFSLNFYFINTLNYRGEIQKIFYRGTLLSLAFACFTSAGFFIAYSLNPQDDIENYSLVKSWLVQFTKFLKYGLLYTVLILLWIYFHPNNQLKRKKKPKQDAKDKGKEDAKQVKTKNVLSSDSKDPNKPKDQKGGK